MEYPLQLRDMRFVLFEHLKAHEALGLDEDIVEGVLDILERCRG